MDGLCLTELDGVIDRIYKMPSHDQDVLKLHLRTESNGLKSIILKHYFNPLITSQLDCSMFLTFCESNQRGQYVALTLIKDISLLTSQDSLNIPST